MNSMARAPLDYEPRSDVPRIRLLPWGWITLAAGVCLIAASARLGSRTHRPDARRLARIHVHRAFSALHQFAAHNGRFPTQAEGLDILVIRTQGVTTWKGPYLQHALRNDPWGRPYVYEVSPRQDPQEAQVTSMGPDGKLGTADDIAADWRNIRPRD